MGWLSRVMRHIVRNERGQTVIEYVLVLVIVVLAVVLLYIATVTNAVTESLLKIVDIIRGV